MVVGTILIFLVFIQSLHSHYLRIKRRFKSQISNLFVFPLNECDLYAHLSNEAVKFVQAIEPAVN